MTISDTDSNAATPAINFYGKMLTFSRLQLHTDDMAALEAQLAQTLSNKESNIPVIIDSSVEQDLSALVDLLWSWGLQPIGVVTGILEEQARALRLAIFPADGKRIERIVPKKAPIVEPQTQEAASTAADTTPAPQPDDALASEGQNTTLIYDQMLRSGQSLNHVGGDLILTNSVNSGAEAITDNSLHVYGRAQGRLVAGATGDKDARIFCHVFNPTLVSVAGTYCLRDNLPDEVIDRAVQVRFVEGEGLVFSIIDDD